jgi:triacylglycerol lipase
MIPILGLWLLLGAAAEEAVPLRAEAHPADELVVLVHGLGRTPLSMAPLAATLRREGYRVVNHGWSSTGSTIEEIGDGLWTRIEQERASEAFSSVHLVGHSTGGIAIRWLLERELPSDLGRVVLIAPPNHGARSADRWAPWLEWLFPALDELTTGRASTVRRLRPPSGFDVGVIAGRHDGKVDPDEARIPGAHFVLVPGVHTFLMNQPGVQRLTLAFLREGRFED